MFTTSTPPPPLPKKRDLVNHSLVGPQTPPRVLLARLPALLALFALTLPAPGTLPGVRESRLPVRLTVQPKLPVAGISGRVHPGVARMPMRRRRAWRNWIWLRLGWRDVWHLRLAYWRLRRACWRLRCGFWRLGCANRRSRRAYWRLGCTDWRLRLRLWRLGRLGGRRRAKRLALRRSSWRFGARLRSRHLWEPGRNSLRSLGRRRWVCRPGMSNNEKPNSLLRPKKKKKKNSK